MTNANLIDLPKRLATLTRSLSARGDTLSHEQVSTLEEAVAALSVAAPQPADSSPIRSLGAEAGFGMGSREEFVAILKGQHHTLQLAEEAGLTNEDVAGEAPDLMAAILSAIQSHHDGDLEGWELDLIRRAALLAQPAALTAEGGR